MTRNSYYDVIIIGAGIGGLVCAAYLAKAGRKTLLIEKNKNVGGYCTSFFRRGLFFDACAHSLGSCGEGEVINTVLNDLSLTNKIKFVRYNPSDIIISSSYKISLWNNRRRVIDEIRRKFKQEYNIDKFFKFLENQKGFSSISLCKKTFDDLLKEYVKTKEVRALFSILLLGNLGLPSSSISAFTAVKFYQQFILDGGYYPIGGMQAFPDCLSDKFKSLGGHLMVGNAVTEIKFSKDRVVGVRTKDGDRLLATKYLISDCDMMHTFQMMNGEKATSSIKNLKKMTPSLSMLILYLGAKSNSFHKMKLGTNYWFLPNFNVKKMYLSSLEGRIDRLDWFLLRGIVDSKNNIRSLLGLVNAPFINIEFWKKNKKKYEIEFIKKLSKIKPNIEKSLVFQDSATPATLRRWTNNHMGAAYGWESTPRQFMILNALQGGLIKNLFFSGHWSTIAQGIPGVVFLGKSVARKICNNYK